MTTNRYRETCRNELYTSNTGYIFVVPILILVFIHFVSVQDAIQQANPWMTLIHRAITVLHSIAQAVACPFPQRESCDTNEITGQIGLSIEFAVEYDSMIASYVA